ncbi:protocadherin beta-13-like [Etheostoma spectabile]|uniref:protocadherin beta-13-like n=1 Tax=Etheostoma spectabile TaxID=54343 RepID=UPI0013AF86C2|nr:protocadherin beta-13-like [Etheostoma spectabile]
MRCEGASISAGCGEGRVVVNDRIDREALCGQSASCVLPLQIVIDKPLQLHRVEVEIQDINDNSPRFPSQDIVLEISESTAAGARFPLENAQDLDVGVNSVRSYTISKDDFFSLKIKDVSGGRKVPELVLSKSVDREKKARHQLQLTALDGGNPVKSGNSQIIINVLDINDNFPVFEKNIYKVSISENSVQDAPLLKLTAKDIDKGPNGEVEYSFGTHTPDIVLSVFDIDSSTGEIRLIGKLDFETNANYEVDVSAKDKGTPRMEGHCTLHIEVLDINDNAPNIFLTSQPNSVPEDAPSGTVVALISARDLDSGDNGKVTLQLPRGSPFDLKPSFSDNYALVTGGALDRESLSEHNVEITATDLGSPPLSTKKTIHVYITDVNDNPPIFTQPSYNVYFKRGMAWYHSYTVLSVSIDLDFGENAKISTLFWTLNISQHASFDYEKLKVFQIQVQAKDQGSPSLSSNATVHVFFLDQNDNAPAVIYPSSVPAPSSSGGCPAPVKQATEYSDFTLIKPSSTNDFKEVISVWMRLYPTAPGPLRASRGVRTKRTVSEQDDSSQRLLIEIQDREPVQSATVRSVFRSCMSPMSEYSDFTLIKPSSTNDFKEVISVLDASLPDSTWTFESQQVSNMEGGKTVPELVLEKPLDREKKAVHKIILTALDGGNPVRSGTLQITIHVLDTNDNFPVFEKNIYKVTLGEKSLHGAVVIKPKATDADEGLNGEIEFSFGSRTPESVLSLFDINPLTGEITLKGELDYETTNSYDIDVSAKDKGSPEMEGHCRVQVDITDFNDNAPEIVFTSQPKPIREDSPSGTVVALINARDLDSSDNGKVTLQLTKGSPFNLKPSFSNNYALVTNGLLDRESFSEYNIEITASDAGSPPLSLRKLTVSITDVNDNPPIFTQPSIMCI